MLAHKQAGRHRGKETDRQTDRRIKLYRLDAVSEEQWTEVMHWRRKEGKKEGRKRGGRHDEEMTGYLDGQLDWWTENAKRGTDIAQGPLGCVETDESFYTAGCWGSWTAEDEEDADVLVSTTRPSYLQRLKSATEYNPVSVFPRNSIRLNWIRSDGMVSVSRRHAVKLSKSQNRQTAKCGGAKSFPLLSATLKPERRWIYLLGKFI